MWSLVGTGVSTCPPAYFSALSGQSNRPFRVVPTGRHRKRVCGGGAPEIQSPTTLPRPGAKTIPLLLGESTSHFGSKDT